MARPRHCYLASGPSPSPSSALRGPSRSPHGPPPLLLRGSLIPTNLTYGYTNAPLGQPRTWTLAARGLSGSEAEVVLGLNRTAITDAPGAHRVTSPGELAQAPPCFRAPHHPGPLPQWATGCSKDGCGGIPVAAGCGLAAHSLPFRPLDLP